MSGRHAPFGAWNRFWFERPALHTLAAFRLLFGAYLVWYVGRDLGRVELLYSEGGVYVPYLLPDLAPGAAAARTLHAAWLALAALFCAGLWTRAVTPLLLVATLYHQGLNIAVTHSVYDRLVLLFLFYLCFARSDRVWSLAAWRARDRAPSAPGDPTASNFASRLIQVQLAVFYLGVGLRKLVSPEWHSGEVLVFNFQGDWASPLGFWIVNLGLPGWAFAIGAWSVIVFEISMGFGLFSKRLRPAFAAAGLLFHSAVFAVLGFPEFYVCVCAYVLFFEDERLRRWVGAPAPAGAVATAA